MKYRSLGNTGVKVSIIGFGGIPIQRVPLDAAVEVLKKALAIGINFFDTARAYTDSEAKLGLAVKNDRKKVIIATKSMARTRDEMALDIKKSIEIMGLQYIDLYQLHNVKDEATLKQVLGPQGALAALKDAKREGLIKHIGITGHIKKFLLTALKTGEFETVQFPFNFVESDGALELIELANKLNIGVIVMKPLAGGVLSNPKLALRYILEKPVSTVIPGIASIEQLTENVSVGNRPVSLSVGEKKQLEEESAKLANVFCRRCEYCMPCPQGIDIPMVFLLDGYYQRYGLESWAKERYNCLKVKANACLKCGECEKKCPYCLPISQILGEAEIRLASKK